MPRKRRSGRKRKASAAQRSYRALVKKYGVMEAARIWRKKR